MTPPRTRVEAARNVREAKARLSETIRQTRAQLMPQALAIRARNKAHEGAIDILNAAKVRLVRNKRPIIGAVAGVGLLLMVRPLLNALKPNTSETNDDE